jgi:UDP-N-acetylglucosamine transferase subunit ALG13
VILSEAFPGISILPLRGYHIQYSRNKRFFSLKILLQLPKILSSIRRERKWLKSVIEQYQISGVISDNRFGLYSNKIPCVFITHQLQIQSGSVLLDSVIQKLNYRFINRFTECWVPDVEDNNNFAGDLSHPRSLPSVPVKYLGILSRFKKINQPVKYAAAFIISGPEPQRSIFEKIIFEQLKGLKKPLVVVRGLPNDKIPLNNENANLTIFNHLNADELSQIMQQSEVVIARSGYSTVMDLMEIQKKSVLVPTPGQTEQEYLAKYLSEKRLCLSVGQDEFLISEALSLASSFDYNFLENAEIKESVISQWLAGLKKDA